MEEARPATAKGEATRRRILDAAFAEFAAHGIAGSRVDRIAAAAETNKAQLYAYFGSKAKLFDAVFFASMRRILDDAPIDPDHLGDWAVRLYDDYLTHPELVRLALWHRLERRPHGLLVEEHERLNQAKLNAITAPQRAGQVRRAEPFDAMALVLGMSHGWPPASTVWAASPDGPERVHDARRTLLGDAVTAAVAPDG